MLKRDAGVLSEADSSLQPAKKSKINDKEVLEFELLKIANIGVGNTIDVDACHVQLYTLSEMYRSKDKEAKKLQDELNACKKKVQEYKKRYETVVSVTKRCYDTLDNDLMRLGQRFVSGLTREIDSFTDEPDNVFEYEPWENGQMEKHLERKCANTSSIIDQLINVLVQRLNKCDKMDNFLSRVNVSDEEMKKKLGQATRESQRLTEISGKLQEENRDIIKKTKALQHRTKSLEEQLKQKDDEIQKLNEDERKSRRLYEKLKFRFAWYIKYEHKTKNEDESKNKGTTEQESSMVKQTEELEVLKKRYSELENINESRINEIKELVDRNVQLAHEISELKNNKKEITKDDLINSVEYIALNEKLKRVVIEYEELRHHCNELTTFNLDYIKGLIQFDDAYDAEVLRSKQLIKQLLIESEEIRLKAGDCTSAFMKQVELDKPHGDFLQREIDRLQEYIRALQKKMSIMKHESKRSAMEKEALLKRILAADKRTKEMTNRCFRCRWIESLNSTNSNTEINIDFEKINDIEQVVEKSSDDELRSYFKQFMILIKGIKAMYDRVENAKDESLKEMFNSDEYLKLSKMHSDQIEKLQEELEKAQQSVSSYAEQFEETDSQLEEEVANSEKLRRELSERDSLYLEQMQSVFDSKQETARANRKLVIMEHCISQLREYIELQKLENDQLKKDNKAAVDALKAKTEEIRMLNDEFNKYEDSQGQLLDQVKHQDIEIQKLKKNELVLKESIDKYSVDKEAYDHRIRRAEEISSQYKLKYDICKNERNTLRKSVAGGGNEFYIRQITELQSALSCCCCKENRKDTIITKCLHMFCSKCVTQVIETRKRKCPSCATSFGAGDYKSISLE
ncbi:E3 ubiquitin-protein ligase Bre1 [Strongyloides ratti]|uniref:E3 ubiquitin protein ligase n=1 Tax=Strongyloides ratti TaxID=34506 RepID=A0A090LFQ0_STRRB|nr:E3 ubiquitin-protein ligase Bre1 [Strongyloides ratti]CEF66315.1 E3 ubiquitin-protein ligase Bre1 [Strongyloides ratti]